MELQYPRGSIVLTAFPFEESPSTRGPKKHFCLVIDSVELDGRKLFAVVYGTSQLDKALLDNHAGAVMSMPREFVKIRRGFMESAVGHFVLNHVALVPGEWIDQSFEGRLDFMREESRVNDPLRQRLYRLFLACEPVMQMAALEATKHATATGRFGLPPGKSLRKKPVR